MMMGFLRRFLTRRAFLTGRAPLQVAGLTSLCRGLRTGGAVAELPAAALEGVAMVPFLMLVKTG
jgi:hypothetical protein